MSLRIPYQIGNINKSLHLERHQGVSNYLKRYVFGRHVSMGFLMILFSLIKLIKRVLIFYFILSQHLVFADTITMHNGDRLTGVVLKQTGDVLLFQTEYGGPYEISWAAVKELETENPVEVLLEDDTLLETCRVIASDVAVPAAVQQQQVAAIKPEAWQKDDWKFSGQINAAFNFQRGNNDTDELDFDGTSEIRDKNDRFTLRGELERNKAQNIVTLEKWNAITKYDRFLNERVYTGVGARSEEDKFADLQNRTRVGPHIGYQFYDDDTRKLSGELSAERVWEEFNNESRTEFWATGWRIEYTEELIPGTLQFYHRHIGLLDVEATDKYLFDAWTGFRWPIAFGVVGSVEHQYKFVSQPAQDAQKDDHIYNARLGYEW